MPQLAQLPSLLLAVTSSYQLFLPLATATAAGTTAGQPENNAADIAPPLKLELNDTLDYNQDCVTAISKTKEINNRPEARTDDVETVPIFLSGIRLSANDEKEGGSREAVGYTIPLLSCLASENQMLVDIVRELMYPPSTEAYHLTLPLEDVMANRVEVPTEVDDLVFDGKKKGGFFIEAGGHDFETDSDSLLFEVNHGWTGLLVEPNVILFDKGIRKNRKATSINHCLSTVNRPQMMRFNMNMNSFINATEEMIEVQCFPLYTILLAMGNPTVDYFSLDIEGAEFSVLKTIPWDKVDIRVWSIETHFAGTLSSGSREDIIEYMDSVGYHHIPWGHQNGKYVIWPSGLTHEIVNDLFVKKGTKVKTQQEKAIFLPTLEMGEDKVMEEMGESKEAAKEAKVAVEELQEAVEEATEEWKDTLNGLKDETLNLNVIEKRTEL